MEATKILDTYFLNSEKALEIANQKNRVQTSVKDIDALQICYYAGETKIQKAPKNCIHVPLEEVFNYFVNSKKRFPKAISFENTEFSMPEQAQLNHAFEEILNNAKIERTKLVDIYLSELKKISPNFNEEKLRVFIPACRETAVMQYVSKNIADAFEELGYEVLYHIQDDMGDCNILSQLVEFHNFNPHIIVNINHFNNFHLNKNIFNFIWIQDPMPKIFEHEEPLYIRDRDYVYTLVKEYDSTLLKRGLNPDRLFSQSFATNPKIFFEDKTIKKENKVVFLGSDYSFEESFNIKSDDEILLKLYDCIDRNELNSEILQHYAKKLNVTYKDMSTWIIASLVRRRVIIWLCSIKDITVEIYGTNKWLRNPETAPFYKGLLPYGKEMAKVYNSAKYSICVHPIYKYQQRLFEISACGSIPLVYDCELMTEDFEHDDNILSFSTLEELEKSIGQKPKKDSRQIAEDISYKNMVQRITKIIEEELEEK